MRTKVFIANLAPNTAETKVQNLLAQFGTVLSCSMPDKKRGFAIVEMSNAAEAESAVKALNGRQFEGRPIPVSIYIEDGDQ